MRGLAMTAEAQRTRRCGIFDPKVTHSLGHSIMQPHFGQAHAKLACEMKIVASGPGPDRSPDSSAPQPPGARTDRARASRMVQSPNPSRPAFAGLFSWAGGEGGEDSKRRQCETPEIKLR